MMGLPVTTALLVLPALTLASFGGGGIKVGSGPGGYYPGGFSQNGFDGGVIGGGQGYPYFGPAYQQYLSYQQYVNWLRQQGYLYNPYNNNNYNPYNYYNPYDYYNPPVIFGSQPSGGSAFGSSYGKNPLGAGAAPYSPGFSVGSVLPRIGGAQGNGNSAADSSPAASSKVEVGVGPKKSGEQGPASQDVFY